MLKMIFPISFLIIFILVVSSVHVQAQGFASQSAGMQKVESDFAKDIQDGQLATMNDIVALQNQNDLQNSETISINEDGQAQNSQMGIDGGDMSELSNELDDQGRGTSATTSGVKQSGDESDISQ